MTLAQLQARLKELTGELTALEAKLTDAAATAEAKAAAMADIQAKMAEAEKVEKDIATLKSLEALKARAAAPADQPVIAAEVKKDLKPKEKIGIVISGMVSALFQEGTRGFRPAMKQIEEAGYAQIAKEFDLGQKGRSLISANATAGGILLPETMSNEIIDLLRPMTTYLAGGPQVIPMPNGTYKMAAAASGSTAAYRGEAKSAAVTQPAFKAINMSAKLLAGIVPISNQLIRWSGPDVGAWAETDLITSMGTVMDYAAYFGDGTVDTPLGMFNIDNVYSVAATNSTTPSYTQCDSDARKLINRLTNSAVPMVKVAWRMAPRVFGYLQDLRDGNGNAIYPTLQGDNPTWKTFPVMTSTQFPINLGGTTDGSYIALIAFGHAMFGDALRTQLAISDQASVASGGTVIHAFQDGVTVLRAESEHDFDLRYVEAVAVLNSVRWGA